MPDLDDEVALVHMAIKKGMTVLLHEAEERDPHEPTRSQLATSAAGVPQIRWALERGETSAGGLPAQEVTPHRCIEPYIATSVSERLRQRLEDALSARPAWDEEGLWEHLLDLGVGQLEKDPSLLEAKPKVSPEDIEELRAEVHHHLQAMRQRARARRSG